MSEAVRGFQRLLGGSCGIQHSHTLNPEPLAWSFGLPRSAVYGLWLAGNTRFSSRFPLPLTPFMIDAYAYKMGGVGLPRRCGAS